MGVALEANTYAVRAMSYNNTYEDAQHLRGTLLMSDKVPDKPVKAKPVGYDGEPGPAIVGNQAGVRADRLVRGQ